MSPNSENPAMREALSLHRRGEVRAALAKYQALLIADPNNAELLHYLGLACLQSGDTVNAEKHLTRSLHLSPACANTLSDLASLYSHLERYGEAIGLFVKALELNPAHTDALNNLGNTFNKMNRPREALPLFERVARLLPRSANAHRQVAQTRYKLGDNDAAIESFREAIRLDPNDKVARLGLGDAFESAGQFAQARLQYEALLRRDPRSPLALAKLLSLKEGEVDIGTLATARDLAERAAIKPEARARLGVALGHYYDRHKEYDLAFHFLKLGNDQQFAIAPYDAAGFTRAIDRLIEVFTPEFFAQLEGPVSDSERPIFIVGMPRSGTTLTEQILATHTQVAAGGELATMLSAAMSIPALSSEKLAYPEGIRTLGSRELNVLAERYLKRIGQVSEAALRVTDKLPFNFMHLGLIASLFSSARIIHCSRQPLDNCLSCYFTGFAEQIRFANDLQTLGSYYVDYARLMAHWRKTLPMPIFELPYESLVDDTENVTRKLLEHCGLEWQDECLAYYRNPRGVRTPSRWQVRQPIYRSSIERWRPYEKQLEPLIQALAPLERLPSDPLR